MGEASLFVSGFVVFVLGGTVLHNMAQASERISRVRSPGALLTALEERVARAGLSGLVLIAVSIVQMAAALF